MRSAIEIQKAHDSMVAIVLGEVPNPFNPEKKFKPDTVEERVFMEQLSVLCWILGHDHNPTFGNNLAVMNHELAQMGYIIEPLHN